MAVNPVLPPPIRQWPSWQAWASYALPLFVFSGAPWWGLDAEVLALAGIAIALTHWFLPPLSVTLLLLGSGQLISLANAEKLRDTGDAILWQDVSHTLPNLFGNLGTLWQYVGLGNLLAGAIALLLLLAVLMLERRHLRRSLRIGAGFSTALMLFYLPTTIDYSLAVAADMRQFRESARGFAGRLNTLSLARFLHSVTLPPADFHLTSGDPELFREQSARLPVPAAGTRALPPPDIFVILNESQFNPSQLAACAGRNDCRMPLYETHRQSTARGPLKVHTHGWGTWNAEFTLMTGIPYFWFGETGFYSAYTTAPRMRMALARHLSALGYRTIGIYPTQKGMLGCVNYLGRSTTTILAGEARWC